MSKQQTAVDYLVEKLNQCEPFYSGVKSLEHKHYIDGLIEQAKAMEKEQIMKAYEGLLFGESGYMLDGEQYYNETYI